MREENSIVPQDCDLPTVESSTAEIVALNQGIDFLINDLRNRPRIHFESSLNDVQLDENTEVLLQGLTDFVHDSEFTITAQLDERLARLRAAIKASRLELENTSITDIDAVADTSDSLIEYDHNTSAELEAKEYEVRFRLQKLAELGITDEMDLIE